MIEYAVGIDPGYATCGIGLLKKEDQRWDVERVWDVKTSPRMPFMERMATVHRDVLAALLRATSKSFLSGIRVTVACEAQENAQEGNRKRGTTNADALRVQQVVGMVMGLCFQQSLTLVQPTPAQVKAVLGGVPRTAPKTQVMRALRVLVNGCPEKMSEHVSDALAAGVAGVRLRHQDEVRKEMTKR